jgi:hypothetical protein
MCGGRPVPGRLTRETILFAAALALAGLPAAQADDAIDQISRRSHIPPELMNEQGYSDFTDPLNRFLDLLAAGAFAEARSIQPKACAAWLATRTMTPLTGRVWIWDSEVNLDTLCAPH